MAQRVSKSWKFEDGDEVASFNSRFAVNMCFTNRTDHVVDALWVNFEGQEVSYGLIKPGATHLLFTYLTHPWVFRNCDNREEVLVVYGKPVAWPNQTQTFADITEAPFLPWSQATHASTFRKEDPDFARDVRNLLLAYYAQRRSNGKACDAAQRCHDSDARKSRHSSTGGCLESEAHASPNKASVPCCGVQLWQRRGLEGCTALHTPPTHSGPDSPQRAPSCTFASGSPSATAAAARRHSRGGVPVSASFAPHSPLTTPASAGRQSSPSVPPQALPQPEDGCLGQLPFDIILEIIAKMAPPLRDYKPIEKNDMEVMPLGVEPARGPVALKAAQILGPKPPPAPVAEPEAWFAAVNAGVLAPPAAPQQPGGEGPLAPPPQLLAVDPQAEPELVAAAAVAAAVAAAGAAAAAGAPVSPQVAEIMLYTEATVLANTAMTHAARMAAQQEVQGQALWRLLQQQAQRLEQEQQQAGGGGDGLQQGVVGAQNQQEEGEGAAAEAGEEEGQDDGSEYGDADDEALEMEGAGDADIGVGGGVGEDEEGMAVEVGLQEVAGYLEGVEEGEESNEEFEDADDRWAAMTGGLR